MISLKLKNRKRKVLPPLFHEKDHDGFFGNRWNHFGVEKEKGMAEVHGFSLNMSGIFRRWT
jgi:hypothetical protein